MESLLEACSSGLRSLLEFDEGSEVEIIDQSASDMAEECLMMLASLTDKVSLGMDMNLVKHKVKPVNCIISKDTVEDNNQNVELTDQVHTLATELESLLLSLTSLPHNDSPEAKQILPFRLKNINDSQASTTDDEDERSVHSKTQALVTKIKRHLEPSIRRPRVTHLNCLQHISTRTTKKRSRCTKVAARSRSERLKVNDLQSWKQYQESSFSKHITRQEQARENEQAARDKHQKALEYHYRTVPRCSSSGETQVKAIQIRAPTSKHPSYLGRFRRSVATEHVEADSIPAPSLKEKALLCSVYLYDRKKETGVLYVTCCTFEHLKQQIIDRFQLQESVLHLYRECMTQQKTIILQRVNHFRHLKNGDVLCATTNPYEDMSILCTWIKQQQISPPKMKIASKSNVKESCSTPIELTTPKNKGGIKFWDENGRCMNIKSPLPL